MINDQEGLQCGNCEEPGALPTGEVGTAWAGCTGGGTATAADDGAGREAEEGEAGLCHGQPGQGALQSGQGIYSMIIQREGGSESVL